MVKLVRMTQAEFDVFHAEDMRRYAADNVRAGYWSAEEAPRRAQELYARLLPEGRQTAGHFFYIIQKTDLEENAGYLWLYVDPASTPPTGFLFLIYLHEHLRGQGLGRQAMQALEEVAREMQLHSLGLHVFAFNEPAISLYKKLGYEVSSLNMTKTLP